MTYDGSSRAGGLILYVDGRRAECEVVRDKLTKNITGGGGDELTVGQRFRDRGFKNGLVDELTVFDRALTPIEVAQLHDTPALAKTLAQDPTRSPPGSGTPCSPTTSPTSTPSTGPQLAALTDAAQASASALVDPVAEIMVMKELPQPRPTFVLRRGAYDAPTEPVSRDTPAALLPFSRDWPRNRLGLARWLTDPRQPLTARVTINRWWQSLFGRGIVATPEDFGSQGQLPSHPELLDWLARRFVDSGWDVKAPLAADRDLGDLPAGARTRPPELLARDPDNVLLGARPAAPAARRDDPRQRPGGERPAGRHARRAAGQAVPARRALGGEGRTSPTPATRARDLIAAASTRSGSGPRRRRPCSPSTPPAARSAPSSGCPRPRRSRPWSC